MYLNLQYLSQDDITLQIQAYQATIIPRNSILAKISFEIRRQLFWAKIVGEQFANIKEPEVSNSDEIGTSIFMVEDLYLLPNEVKEVDTGVAIGIDYPFRFHIKTAKVISELGLFTVQNICSSTKQFNHLRLRITYVPHPTKIEAYEYVALLVMEDLTNVSMVVNKLIEVFRVSNHIE